MSTASWGCDANVRFGADAAEKPKRLVIAAEEHVLPVVHALAGRRIGERGGAPAERRPRLEHEHARAALGQRRRGAQAGEAAADDDDVVVNSKCRIQDANGARVTFRMLLHLGLCSAAFRAAFAPRCAARSRRGRGAARGCAG